MFGVRVRPWCWEVAGLWTAAAWFTTPAAPPHQTSRGHSDSVCGVPFQSGILTFSLPFLIFVTSMTAVKKKKYTLDWKENIRGSELPLGSFFRVHIINPNIRDSGCVWPTSLHLTGITPPTTPCFSSGAFSTPQHQQHPLCKFSNHTTEMRDVCVYVQWRGI